MYIYGPQPTVPTTCHFAQRNGSGQLRRNPERKLASRWGYKVVVAVYVDVDVDYDFVVVVVVVVGSRG